MNRFPVQGFVALVLSVSETGLDDSPFIFNVHLL